MIEYLLRRSAGAAPQPERAEAGKPVQERLQELPPQELPRHDVPTEHGPLDPADNIGGNTNSIIERVVGTSIGEIESLIGKLEQLRDVLIQNSLHIQRELEGYGRLSDEVTTSIKIIAESVAHLRIARDTSNPKVPAFD
jgi:hypothetical protein